MSTSSAIQGTKQVHCTDHPGIVLKRLRAHFECQQLSDVVLISGVDKQRVPAHRLVLSACSPYFSAMFTGSHREATDKEVTLNEVQGDTLQALVSFCYSGCIELRQDTVLTILITGSMLQMDSVVIECTKYLEEQLDSSNCLGMVPFADQHNLQDLQRKAEAYALQEFTQVCKNDEFLQLTATQVAKLIASDDLNVASEEEVFNSIIDWVDNESRTRQGHIRELLTLVRMTQLSPSFIADKVQALCRFSNCQDLFNYALKWHNLTERQQEMATEYAKPRNSNVGVLIAIGCDSSVKQINIESYCPRSDKWTVWSAHALSYCNEFSVVTMDDNLLIVGGQNHPNQTLNTIVNFNLTTLAVTYLKPMNTARLGLCVAVLDNTLYAIGGFNDPTYLNTVERWNPVECCWNYVAPMTTPRVYAGAAVLNGCLYVVGGHYDHEDQKTVASYNPLSNTWTDCASMCVARAKLGVAVSNGFLYAVGGENADGSPISSAECYDPITNKWTMIESMSVAGGFLHCTFLGKCLMAVCGVNSSLVEEYNPETKKWRKRGSLTRKYRIASSCIVPNRFMSNLSHQLQ